MSETGSINRQRKREDGREELSAQEKEQQLLAKIDYYIDRCRDLYRNDLISSVTRSSYESMLQELRDDTSNANRLRYVKENVGFLRQTLAKAQAEEAKMHAKLQEEKRGNYSDRDIEEMTAWFRSDSLVELERSRALDEKISAFVAKHEKIGMKRKALLERIHALGDDDVEGIAVLRDDEAFLSLDASARKNLLARLESADLAGLSGKKRLFAETRTMLDDACAGDGRYLHADATGSMLKQMMSAKKPEEYRGSILLPSLDAYRGTRRSFDAFCEDVATAEEAPIRMPSLDAFLQWSTGKRSSFVAEGRRRLESQKAKEAAEDEALSVAKTRAEHLLKAERWEKAAALLEDAVATHPEDADLQVMLAYVQEHGNETEEERNDRAMDALRDEITALLATLPASVRGLYAAAALRGADAFTLFRKSLEQGAHAMSDTEEAMQDDDDEEAREEEEQVDGQTTPDEVAEETDSVEDREEVLKAVTERTKRAPASLTLSSVTADAQASYRRRINEPLLQKLRALEERDESYGLAA